MVHSLIPLFLTYILLKVVFVETSFLSAWGGRHRTKQNPVANRRRRWKGEKRLKLKTESVELCIFGHVFYIAVFLVLLFAYFALCCFSIWMLHCGQCSERLEAIRFVIFDRYLGSVQWAVVNLDDGGGCGQ